MTISVPVIGTRISVATFGKPVVDAVNDHETRIAAIETAELLWTPKSAVKSGTTSRNNTASPAADPHLAIALAANSTWEIKAVLFITSAANAAGDFLAQFDYPADATISSGGLALNNALASGSSASLEAAAGAQDSATPGALLAVGASTSPTMAVMEGRLTIVTAGTLTLLWSQFGSNANLTNLLGGSYMIARPL